MDFSFHHFCIRQFRFIKQQFNYQRKQMSALTDLARRVITYLLGREQTLLEEIASLQEQLATALANDAADAAAIAAANDAADAARAAADQAVAANAELQALATADQAEDAELETILGAVPLPEESTPVEPG
jgi:cysteinyl-tRNA synthetase